MNRENRDFKRMTIQIPGAGSNVYEQMRNARTENVTYMATFTGLKQAPSGGCTYLRLDGRPYADKSYERIMVDRIKHHIRARIANLGKIDL